jgi:autotransporter-associated beta strand protein
MFRSLWHKLTASPRPDPRPAPRRRAVRPQLEDLENRCVPTTFQWVGTSATSNHWSDAQNWVQPFLNTGLFIHGVPGQGDDIVFAGGEKQFTNVDDLNVSFGIVKFTGAGYDVKGGPSTFLTFASMTATNAAGTNTVEAPIGLLGPAPITVTNGPATLVLNGTILAGSAAPVTKDGAGRLVLGGANEILGGVAVTDGELRLTNNLGLGDTGATARVQNGSALELADGVSVNNVLLQLQGGSVLHALGSSAWVQPITSTDFSVLQVDAGGTLTVGQVRGPGETFTLGPGTIDETAAVPPGVSQSTIQMEGGTFLANNPPEIGAVDVLAGTLGGTGHVAEITAEAGVVEPDANGIGTLFCAGPATLGDRSTFRVGVFSGIALGGFVSPAASGLLDVTGTVAINSAFLDPLPSGTLTAAQFTILHSDGGRTGTFRFQDPGTGAIRTLNNGDPFPVSGREYTITYTAHDVMLTLVPGASLPAFQNRSVTVTEGSVATLRGTIVDPAPQGAFVLRVDWGDDTPVQTVTVPQGTALAAALARPGAVVVDPSGTIALTHHYHKSGTFDVHMSWGDDRGTTNTADLSATVAPVQRPPAEVRLDHQDHLGSLYWTIPDINDPSAHQNPNTFVGKVPGTNAFIAVVMGGDQAIAYVCDSNGEHVKAWLHGEVRDGLMTLTDDHGDRIVSRLQGDTVIGLVDVRGLGERTFTADRAVDGESGLFRGVETINGQTGVLSTIVIGDEERGAVVIPRRLPMGGGHVPPPPPPPPPPSH